MWSTTWRHEETCHLGAGRVGADGAGCDRLQHIATHAGRCRAIPHRNANYHFFPHVSTASDAHAAGDSNATASDADSAEGNANSPSDRTRAVAARTTTCIYLVIG